MHLLSIQTTKSWKLLINNKFKAQSLNQKSHRKFTLSCFSITCFKHVVSLWPISVLDRKQVHGYIYSMSIYLYLLRFIWICGADIWVRSSNHHVIMDNYMMGLFIRTICIKHFVHIVLWPLKNNTMWLWGAVLEFCLKSTSYWAKLWRIEVHSWLHLRYLGIYPQCCCLIDCYGRLNSHSLSDCLTNFETHRPEGPLKFLVWPVIGRCQGSSMLRC